jgi:cytidine deaminase
MVRLTERRIKDLISAAADAMERAYAPYSRYPVGAALITADGSVFAGCNVENASTPCGVCAERAALVKAVSEGHRKFAALAVIAKGDDYCTPCGLCRQSLAEFSKDLAVFCCNGRGEYLRFSLRKLLYHAFAGYSPTPPPGFE